MATWLQKAGDWIMDRWNDFTGNTAVREQNKANLNLAKYQAQLNEDFYNKYSSPEAMMRQYEEAGLNRNLVYGSAGAGQSNVPSFNAPNVERNVSGSEKVNKVLSLLNQASGVMTGVYQAIAAREAAEQSGIKTLNDIVNLSKNRGDLRLQNTLFGMPLYDNDYVSKFGSKRTSDLGLGSSIGTAVSDFMNSYSSVYRESTLNKLARARLENQADFGWSLKNDGSIDGSRPFGTPYIFGRNALQGLNYQLKEELGNSGTYGKLLLQLLGLFAK